MNSIRLFDKGLALQEDGTWLAEPFPPERLCSSPLFPGASIMESLAETAADGTSRWTHAADRNLPGPLYITGTASSSLDVAAYLCRMGLLPEWGSVLCLSQTSGRGQLRHLWSSPAGNIYAAVRLPLEEPFAGTAAAPAIGALLAESLGSAGCPVLLKWPNDMLQAQDPSPALHPHPSAPCVKVGGILLEQRNGCLNAGIGLNLASAPLPSDLRDRHAFNAGVLRSVPLQNKRTEAARDRLPMPPTIFELWKHLVVSMHSLYETLSGSKLWWVGLAQKHLAFKGCHAVFTEAVPEHAASAAGRLEGLIDGLEPSGSLRIMTKSGPAAIMEGSLLPAG